MSDSLRDRIAAVLADEFKRQGYACEWAVLADAVIRELELKEERADKQRPMHVCATPGLYYRYVTEWTTDE